MTTVVGGKFYPDFKPISTILPLENSQNAGFIWFQMDEGYVKPHKVSLDDFNLQFLKPYTVNSFITLGNTGNVKVTSLSNGGFKLDFDYSGIINWIDTNDFKIITTTQQGITYNTGLPNWTIPNTYTDTKVTALATKTTSDIATAKQQAIDTSKTYTDGQVTNLGNKTTADIATAKQQAITDSKTYTDGQITQSINTSKTYTDGQVTNLGNKTTADIATAKQQAITASETYTDAQIPITMRSLLMPATQGNCVVTQNTNKTFVINYNGGSGGKDQWKDTSDFKVIPVIDSGITYNTGLPNWTIPNTYTDTKVTDLATKTTADIATAKQEVASISEAYTDQAITELGEDVEVQIATAKQQAITDSKTYTDGEITIAINNLEDDIAEVLTESKTYTDTKVADLATKTTSDIATSKQEAITTSETYTDTKVADLATKTTSDIATSKQEAITTSETYTDNRATSTLQAAKTYTDNQVTEVREDFTDDLNNRQNYIFVELLTENYQLAKTNYNVYAKRIVNNPYFIVLPDETIIGAVYTISVELNSDYIPLDCSSGYTIENSVIVDPNEDTIINPQQIATCILAEGNVWKVRISNSKITPIANSTVQDNFPKLPQGGDLVHAKDVGTLWYFDNTLGVWTEIKQPSSQGTTITSWSLNNAAGQPLTMVFTGLEDSANPAYKGLLPNNTINIASWRRVKDTLQIKGKLQISGNGVTQTVPELIVDQMYYRVKIDPIQGLAIDLTKIDNSSTNNFVTVGTGEYFNNKTGQIGTLTVFYISIGFIGELFFRLDTQQIQRHYPQTNLAQAGSVFGVPSGDKTQGQTLFLGEGNIEIFYNIEYPVVGWN